MSDASSGSPYRAGRASAPVAEAHEDGIVDELIQQFADPLAFYRELVQNSIDAGSTRIGVTLGWDPKPGDEEDPLGVARITVRDDGCGMSRHVLENQLTVLFRSGKEGQTDKIGKFGVGFVSVLALKPEHVVVRTDEGAGELWTLVLKSDQTYELFQAQGGQSSGTSVSLEVTVRRSELDGLVSGSERALVTWCRHAELPIRFVASLPGEPMHEVRVDRPLGLDALVQVRLQEGSTTVVAGVTRGTRPYLGFFNRGLLLHETRKPVLGTVHMKIQDANLEHTLSRDNVRRDTYYERAMKVARRAIDDRLTDAVQQRFVDLCAGREGSPKLDQLELDRLLRAALRAGLAVDYDALRLPLTDAVARPPRVSKLKKGAWAARQASALTEAMARRGMAVLDLSVGSDPASYLSVLSSLLGTTPVDPEGAMSLVLPVATTGADEALLDAVSGALAVCARRPSSLRFAAVEYRRRDALSLCAEVGKQAVAVTHDEATEDPFRMLMRPPLVLNTEAPIVAQARELARDHPRFAGAMLARAVLVERGRLDESADDDWLEHAFAEMDA